MNAEILSATGGDIRGQVIDHYMLLRVLGRGGMGEVYLARDQRLGRKVALKMVHSQALGDEAVQRFMREAQITARFNHPNIVTVYGVGEYVGQPYVALEFLDGVTLRERLQTALTEREAMRVGLAIASALAEAHKHGILHRDLKPENVIIPHDGRLRVVDFGLARSFSVAGAPTHTSHAGIAAVAQPSNPTLLVGGDPNATQVDARLSGRANGAATVQVNPPRIDAPSADNPTVQIDPADLPKPAEGNDTGQTRAIAPSLLGALSASTAQPGSGPQRNVETIDIERDPALGVDPSDRQLAGTPLYMAPEQWLGQSCSAAVDVWALGLMLREMLTGEHVHMAYANQAMLALYLIVTGPSPIAPLSESVATPTLLSLIARCLDKDPSKRPSAAEVVGGLQDLLEPHTARPNSDESPFRGLLTLTEQHASRFFGREDETLAIVERLRDEPLIAIVGPSGVGKSSLVYAGVVPRLRERTRWRVISLRPGRTPLRALVTRLLRDDLSTNHSQVSMPAIQTLLTQQAATIDARCASLRQAPGTLALWLQQLAQQEQANILLFVDQLEESYTLADDPAEGRAFIEAICSAADESDSPVRVLLTLRDDFLGRLADVNAARIALRHSLLLGAPNPQMLHEAFTRLLAFADYTLDDPSVLAQMIEAVQGEPSALPLLQVAGQALWERRDRQARTLRRADYDAIGGIEGALADQADTAIKGLNASQVDIARRLLLRLVTADGTRRSSPQSQLLDGLPDEAGSVLQRLIQARLLTTLRRTDALEGAEVELAHESLINTWQWLRRCLDEARGDLVFLDEIERAAALWERRGRPSEEVWHGDALWRALARAARLPDELPGAARAFLAAGREREQRKRRRRFAALSGVFALLVLVAVGALSVVFVLSKKNDEINARRAEAETLQGVAENRRAEAERHHAQANQSRADALQEAARGALEQGDVLTARAMVRAATEIRDDLEARALWMRLKRVALLWSSDPCEQYTTETVIFTSNDTLLTLCLNGNLESVDTRTGYKRRLPLRESIAIARAESSGQIAVARGDGTILIYDDIQKPPSRTLAVPNTTPTDKLMLSADGRFLAAASTTVLSPPMVWDLHSSAEPITYNKHTHMLRGVHLSPDGRTAASLALEEPAQVWDTTTGAPIATLGDMGVHDDQGAAFDKQGLRFAVGGRDGGARVYDTTQWQVQQVIPPPREGRPVWSMAFSVDGHLLALGGLFDVGVWDLGAHRYAAIHKGHKQEVLSVAFSQDASMLASIGADGPKLWNLDEPALSTGPDVPWRGYLVRCEDAGTQVASLGMGPEISLWDRASGVRAETLDGHTEDLFDVAFSPKGVLASASADHTIRVWTPEGFHRFVYSFDHNQFARRLYWEGEDRIWAVTTSGIEVLSNGQRTPTPAAVSAQADPWSYLWIPGRLGVTGVGQDTLRIWSLDDGRVLQTLPGHSAPVLSVAFSPDGKLLASASLDGTFRLWKVNANTTNVFVPPSTQETPIAQWKLPEQLKEIAYDIWLEMVFSPSSDVLAITVDSYILFWDLKTSQILPHSGKNRCGGCFSEDGQYFYAASCLSGGLLGWDMTQRRPLWAYRGLDTKESVALLNQTGWQHLAGALVSKHPFYEAAASRAALAQTFADTACLANHAGEVERWSLASPSTEPAQKYQVSAPIQQLRATASGCLVHTITGEGWLYPQDGRPKLLARDLLHVDVSADFILTLSVLTARVFDHQGQELLQRAPLPMSPVFGGFLGGLPFIGYPDGRLDRFNPRKTSPDPETLYLNQVPQISATQVIEGPANTLILGLLDGQVELWSLTEGRKLDTFKMASSVADLALHNNILYAASERGEVLARDLNPLAVPYCAFLTQLWSEQSALWSDGHTRHTPIDPNHPCASTPPNRERP